MSEINVNELSQVSGGASSQARYIPYIVREGDSQGLIAQRFGITLEELQEANRIKPGQTIHPGDRLLIPNKDFRQST